MKLTRKPGKWCREDAARAFSWKCALPRQPAGFDRRWLLISWGSQYPDDDTMACVPGSPLLRLTALRRFLTSYQPSWPARY